MDSATFEELEEICNKIQYNDDKEIIDSTIDFY